jgi:hypothetical protein
MEGQYKSPLPPEIREEMTKLATLLSKEIIPRYEELSKLKSLDEEEKKEMEQILEVIKKVKPVLDFYRQILAESLVHGSNDIFFRFRELSLQGNEYAKKAYEELRPLYEDFMKENLDLN